MPVIDIVPIIFAVLIIIFIIIKIIKLVFANYEHISREHAVSEFMKYPRVIDNSTNRFIRPSAYIDGGQTTFKEPKSKSLVRYDFIRSNSILRRY